MYIHRQIQEQIKPYLNRKEVLGIIGARQVGKTTFLQHLFSQLKKQGKSVKFLTFKEKAI
ncbi:AAA family ATPase [Patescibacteria group bacterium]|nr:AAA family ATPase [Patescibacteria group bacterium]